MIFLIGFSLVVVACVISFASKESSKTIDELNPESKPDKSYSYIILGCSIAYISLILLDPGDIGKAFILMVFLIPFIWLPMVITGFNVRNLIKNNNASRIIDLTTIILGGFYYILAMDTVKITDTDYTGAVYPDEYHTILNNEYGTVINLVMATGFISMILLCIRTPYKTPPLQSALHIAFTSIMLVLFGIIQIQMARNFDSFFILFYLYYFNLIIVSARKIRYHITEQVRLSNERETVFRTKAGEKLHKIMSTISGMTTFSFMLILPIVIICEIFYILLGQGADGFIKAFTMTADWTFSTQTPPPAMEYEGHYLCTVAAGGHEKIVKPVRYGIRLNKKIVVNRQLLTANAFEDLIKERLPKFHRIIRNFYDKYGYPISKHIITQTRADIIYILMKPLEYIFLAFLYMFDTQPENRIAIQYSEYKK